jgi:hypothetical protein
MLNSGTFGPGNSPKRNAAGDAVPREYDPTVVAQKLYNFVAKEATQQLMHFLSTLHPPQDLCVTYFDEAHELDVCFGILSRLLANQELSIKMWWVFMGTKLSLSYYAPLPANRRFTCFPCTRVTDRRARDFFATERRIGSTATTLCCSWF